MFGESFEYKPDLNRKLWPRLQINHSVFLLSSMYMRQSSSSHNSPISSLLSMFRNNLEMQFARHSTDWGPFFLNMVNQTFLFPVVNNSIINYDSYIQHLWGAKSSTILLWNNLFSWLHNRIECNFSSLLPFSWEKKSAFFSCDHSGYWLVGFF